MASIKKINEIYNRFCKLIYVEKIKKYKITDSPARHFSEVTNYRNHFDSADYASKLFNMYSGEPKPIELACNNDLLEPMLDRFGEKVRIQKLDADHFILRTNAAVSDGLAAWVVQFGGRVKVRMPNDLIYAVKKKAEEILANY